MRLSKREKILIVILIFVSSIYAIYTLAISKTYEELQRVKQEYNHKNELYEIMSEKISMKDLYLSQIEIATLNVDETSKKLLGTIEQEMVIVFLNNYLKKCYVEAEALLFSEAGVSTTIDTNANEEIAMDGIMARVMMVNIPFSSTYSNLLKFIDEIQNNQIEVAVTQLNALKVNETKMQGTITIKFYSLPKVTK